MEQEEKKEQPDEEIEEVKSASERPERTRTSDFISRYTNGVTIVNTQFDIQLLFGRMTLETNGKFVVHEDTMIVMSPAHAKSLHDLLGRRIQDWENLFGKIELRKKPISPV